MPFGYYYFYFTIMYLEKKILFRENCVIINVKTPGACARVEKTMSARRKYRDFSLARIAPTPAHWLLRTNKRLNSTNSRTFLTIRRQESIKKKLAYNLVNNTER